MRVFWQKNTLILTGSQKINNWFIGSQRFSSVQTGSRRFKPVLIGSNRFSSVQTGSRRLRRSHQNTSDQGVGASGVIIAAEP